MHFYSFLFYVVVLISFLYFCRIALYRSVHLFSFFSIFLLVLSERIHTAPHCALEYICVFFFDGLSVGPAGCIITGNMSDVVGRKPVVIGCLLGTVISHIVVARSTTLTGVAWGRMIGGITGGLTPIAQAAVADVVSFEDCVVGPVLFCFYRACCKYILQKNTLSLIVFRGVQYKAFRLSEFEQSLFFFNCCASRCLELPR